MREQIKLSPEQQRLVENNMGLVGYVLSHRIFETAKTGIFTTGDLYQIGCEGLCKAAACYKKEGPAKFSTYAYRVIYNQILDALRYSSLRASREFISEGMARTGHPGEKSPDADEFGSIHAILKSEAAVASPPIQKGIKAMVMRSSGYSAKEISQALNAPPGKVRVWVCRARKHLEGVPALRELAA